MISEDIFGQLAEGVFLFTGANGQKEDLLTPITRNDVKQRRSPSRCSGNFFNNAAPSKKKQKLHIQLEGKDSENSDGSLFEEDFGEKGKDKFLPIEQQPLEANSTDLVWNANSPIISFDDFSYSPEFPDFNFGSPTPIQEVNQQNNIEGIVNQSPEGSLTILQSSSVFSAENSESTETLEASDLELDPLLPQIPTLSIEENICEAKSGTVLPDYNQQESNVPLAVFIAPPSSTTVPNDSFVLVNTSETESLLVPRHIIEYQDGPYPDSKKNQLIAYCSLTDISKDITAMLNEMAAGSVDEETLSAFIQTGMEKFSKLKKSIQVNEVVDILNPQIPVPISISTGPEENKIVVEGYGITRSTWAAAYPHMDIKNAAVDLFEELFTEKEKATATLSGRVCNKTDGTKGKTPRLDPERLNVINHAIASMMQKRSTYHYSVEDFKHLKKTDFKAIKEGLSQRVNQIKQAQKKALNPNRKIGASGGFTCFDF